jgi:hypothetical protein
MHLLTTTCILIGITKSTSQIKLRCTFECTLDVLLDVLLVMPINKSTYLCKFSYRR